MTFRRRVMRSWTSWSANGRSASRRSIKTTAPAAIARITGEENNPAIAIAKGHYGGFAPLGADRRKAAHHQKSDLGRHPGEGQADHHADAGQGPAVGR